MSKDAERFEDIKRELRALHDRMNEVSDWVDRATMACYDKRTFDIEKAQAIDVKTRGRVVEAACSAHIARLHEIELTEESFVAAFRQLYTPLVSERIKHPLSDTGEQMADSMRTMREMSCAALRIQLDESRKRSAENLAREERSRARKQRKNMRNTDGKVS